MTATPTRSRWNYSDLYDAAVEMVTDDVDVTTDEVEFYRDSFTRSYDRLSPLSFQPARIALSHAAGTTEVRAAMGQRPALVALPVLFAWYWTQDPEVVP
jgi:hypothetical protein